MMVGGILGGVMSSYLIYKGFYHKYATFNFIVGGLGLLALPGIGYIYFAEK